MAYNKRPMKGFATLQAQELNSRLVPSTSMAPEIGDAVPALIVEADAGSGSDIAVTSDVVDRSADLLFFTFASDFDESIKPDGEATPVGDESLMYMTFGGAVDELEMVKRSDAPPVDDESLMYMTFGGAVDGEAPLVDDEKLMYATCGVSDGDAPLIDDETLVFASFGAPDEMSPVAEDLGFRPETDVPPNFRGPTLDDPTILENLADDEWAIVDELGDDETLIDIPAVDGSVVDLLASSVPPTMADVEPTSEVDVPVELVSLDGVVPTVALTTSESTETTTEAVAKTDVVALAPRTTVAEVRSANELPEMDRVDLVSFESFANDDDSKK